MILLIAWLTIVSVALMVRIALAGSARHRGVAKARPPLKYAAIHLFALVAVGLAALLWGTMRPDADSAMFLVIQALGLGAGVLVLIGMKSPKQ